MSTPEIPRKGPYAVDAEAGKRCFWCTCGKSANQPWCDGSHQGGDFTPRPWEPEETRTVYLCGCKHTSNPPFCDGSHSKL